MRKAAASLIAQTGVPVTADELSSIEVADFGLGHLAVEGAQILTLLQSERIGVKLLVLTPGQTLPEHLHPVVGSDPGKEETVRVVLGTLLLYSEGGDTISSGVVPSGKEAVYTVRNERKMVPGDQLTLPPGNKHWLQAGDEGAVAFSFSSVARDLLDVFTDPEVQRRVVVRK